MPIEDTSNSYEYKLKRAGLAEPLSTYLADPYDEDRLKTQKLVVLAESFIADSDQLQWQKAIDFVKSKGGGLVTTNKTTLSFNSLVIDSSNITLDFNNAIITTSPSILGKAAILARGTRETLYSANYTNPNSSTIQLTTAADSLQFTVGNDIIISDNSGTNAWNYGHVPETPDFGVSYGYTGKEELNRIEAIDTGTGIITLQKPTEQLYSFQVKVSKVNLLKNIAIKNIGEFREPNPGSNFSGSFDQQDVPHLIQVELCNDPYVENVNVDGFQLHLVNYRRVIDGTIKKCSAKNAFRPTIGGHGYLIRFDKCSRSKAIQNFARSTRHAIDLVMSYDILTEKNHSEEVYASAYITHGFASKRWISIDDSAFTSPNHFGNGFGIGDDAFNADYDIQLIRPKVIGTNMGITISSMSSNIKIIDPYIKAKDFPINVYGGASGIYIKGGYLGGATSNLPHLLLVAPDPYYLTNNTWQSPIKDVTVDGVEFDCTMIRSGSKTTSPIFIDAIGEVLVKNCVFKNSQSNYTNYHMWLNEPQKKVTSTSATISGGTNLVLGGTITGTFKTGMVVFGTGIPNGTTITGSGNNFTLSNTCTNATISLIGSFSRPSDFIDISNNYSYGAIQTVAKISYPSLVSQKISRNRSVGETVSSFDFVATGTTDFLENRNLLQPVIAGDIPTLYQSGLFIRDNLPVYNGTVISSPMRFGGGAGSSRDIQFKTVSSNGTATDRFVLRLDGTAESGTDFGSNLSLLTRADNGSLIGTAFFVERKTASFKVNGTWQSPFYMGTYALWIEVATGKLRVKSSAPTSDADGTVVGTQV